MYLTTLIEEIRKNPEKYEGKEYYKKTYGSIHYKIEDGKLYRKNAHTKYINKVFTVGMDEEIEEIPQEITMEEAVQAYNAGQKVECVGRNNEIYSFSYKKRIKEQVISIDDLLEISKGKWYIKEDT